MWGALAQATNQAIGMLMSNSESKRAYRQQLGLLEAQSNVQKGLMDYQNDINVGNWKMQNEYNTPAAQRERLEKAGLNPNLMFGAGGSVGVASGSAPSVSAQSSPVPHSQGVDARFKTMELAQQSAMNAAQVELALSQAEKNKADAKYTNSNIENIGIKNTFDRLQLSFWQKFGELKWTLDLNESDSRRALNDAQRYVQDMDWRLSNYDLAFTRPAIFKKTLEETALTHLNSDLVRLQSGKTQAETQKIFNDIKLSTALAFSTIGLQAAQSNYYRSNAYVNEQNWKPGTGVLWRLNSNNAATSYNRWFLGNKFLFGRNGTSTVFEWYLGYLENAYRANSRKNFHYIQSGDLGQFFWHILDLTPFSGSSQVVPSTAPNIPGL